MKRIFFTIVFLLIWFGLGAAEKKNMNGSKIYSTKEQKTSFSTTGSSHTTSYEYGSPAQAREMVNEAVAFIQRKGLEKSLTIFNTERGQFIYKDLYIFVLDRKGNVLAHGQDLKLVGTNQIKLKDADGKLLIKEIVDVSRKWSSGWVDYKWKSSSTSKLEAKNTYFKVVNDQYIICCGSYRYKHRY